MWSKDAHNTGEKKLQQVVHLLIVYTLAITNIS
jgi:hypothetical protein